MATPSAVAIYARISSDQDGTALGVTRQLADCRELAARLGWTIAEEYVDNDISAFSGKRRPSYERMLDDLRDRARDAVIVYHVDRLTRRPIELEQFVEVLTASKVRHVRFVAGADVDIANGDGLMVLRLTAAVAANESASKSRRILRKMDEVAAAGRPHGGSRRPFGFENDRITIRPDEAEVIRALAARCLAGESLRSLAIWLDDQQVRTVFDKAWRTTTVRDMITSARVAGLRTHNGDVVPAIWDAIISPTDRSRLLAMFEQKRSTGRRTPRSYLLSGMTRCGKCGGTLFASRREHTRRYVCMAGPDHQGCGRLTVVAGPLEELTAAAVLYRLDTPALADALSGRHAQDEHTAALADAIAQDRAQLDELAELYAARQIPAREWMTARQPIEARVKEAERRLSRVTRNDALVGLAGNGNALRAQWAELNLTRQHAIVRAVLDHAVIAPGTSGARELDPNRVDLVWRL